MYIIYEILEKFISWLLGYGGSTLVSIDVNPHPETDDIRCSKKHVTELISKFEDDIACIENKFKQEEHKKSKKAVTELLDDLNTSIDRKTK